MTVHYVRVDTLFGIELPSFGQSEITCNNCGITEPLIKAINDQTWHVGTRELTTEQGNRRTHVWHLCHKCLDLDLPADFPDRWLKINAKE